MYSKKYRGYQNLWKDIDKWIKQNKFIDLERLEYRQRDWVKIHISPFSNISLSNNLIPQPRGKARKLITQGLVEIYKERKKQLDQLGKPYYLKIWLNDIRFAESQVVCAIDDAIDFYEITHAKPERSISIEQSGIKDIARTYPAFTWEQRFDQELIDFNELGTVDDYYDMEEFLEEKAWYRKVEKKKHKKIIDSSIPDSDYRAFHKGNVWIGDIK